MALAIRTEEMPKMKMSLYLLCCVVGGVSGGEAGEGTGRHAQWASKLPKLLQEKKNNENYQ